MLKNAAYSTKTLSDSTNQMSSDPSDSAARAPKASAIIRACAAPRVRVRASVETLKWRA